MLSDSASVRGAIRKYFGGKFPANNMGAVSVKHSGHDWSDDEKVPASTPDPLLGVSPKSLDLTLTDGSGVLSARCVVMNVSNHITEYKILPLAPDLVGLLQVEADAATGRLCPFESTSIRIRCTESLDHDMEAVLSMEVLKGGVITIPVKYRARRAILAFRNAEVFRDAEVCVRVGPVAVGETVMRELVIVNSGTLASAFAIEPIDDLPPWMSITPLMGSIDAHSSIRVSIAVAPICVDSAAFTHRVLFSTPTAGVYVVFIVGSTIPSHLQLVGPSSQSIGTVIGGIVFRKHFTLSNKSALPMKVEMTIPERFQNGISPAVGYIQAHSEQTFPLHLRPHAGFITEGAEDSSFVIPIAWRSADQSVPVSCKLHGVLTTTNFEIVDSHVTLPTMWLRETTDARFTVKNKSAVRIRVLADCSDRGECECTIVTIDPMTDGDLVVAVTPTTSGNFRISVPVKAIFGEPGLGVAEQVVTISGDARLRPPPLASDPAITTSVSTVDFGSIPVGDRKVIDVQISSTSSELISLHPRLVLPAPFEIVNALRAVSDRQPHIVKVSFHPGFSGTFSSLLQIYSKDHHHRVDILLRGCTP